MKIERVEIGLFNRVSLHNVEIYDQQKQHLLLGKLISCKVELLPLFHNIISFRTVSLVDVDINLYQNKKDESPNYQYFIDSFKSKENNTKSSINLRINSIILRRTHLNYNLKYIPQKEENALDLSHLHLSNINSNISLKSLTNDSISARFRWLSFNEKSGLSIKRMSCLFSANKKRCNISNFSLKMDNSKIEKQNIILSYNWNNKKNSPEKIIIDGNFSKSNISTKDLAPLLPQIKTLNKNITLKFKYRINGNKLSIHDLIVKSSDKSFDLKTDLFFQFGKQKTLITKNLNLFATTSLINLCTQSVAHKKVSLPIEKIGNLSLSSKNIILQLKDKISLKGDFKIRSQFANIFCKNIKFENSRLSGLLDVQNCYLANVLPTTNIKDFSLKTTFDVLFSPNKPIQLNVKGNFPYLVWKDYNYSNLSFHANIHNKLYNLSTKIIDRNINAQIKASGITKQQIKPQTCQLSADIKNFNPNALGLTNNYHNTSFSARVQGNASKLGNNIPIGNLSIKDFSMHSPTSSYQLNSLEITSINPFYERNSITLKSDFLDTQVDGDFSFSQIKALIPNYIKENILNHFQFNPNVNNINRSQVTSEFHLRLKKTDFFNHVLKLPLFINKEVLLNGMIDNKNGLFYLSLNSDSISYNNSTFHNLRLYSKGSNDSLTLIVQGEKPLNNSSLKFSTEIAANKTFARTNLLWKENDFYNGELKLQTNIKANDGTITTAIEQSDIKINDSVWTVQPSKIDLSKNKVSFNHFKVAKSGQALAINGNLSSSTNDSINIDLERIDLEYILNIVGFDAVSFAGLITGNAAVTKSATSEAKLNYNIKVDDFTFNDANMGTADITGYWGTEEGNIYINAFIHDSISNLKTIGYVSPKTKGLDLHFYPHNTTLRFIDRYVNSFFADVDGRVSGNLRLFGPFKKLDFIGFDKAQLNARIIPTGVTYKFETDSVIITPGTFAFKNVKLTDAYGNTGIASGKLEHEHIHNLKYDLSASYNNLLIYDQQKTPDMPFFAKVFGKGDISLKGSPGILSADINIQPQKNTDFTYLVHGPSVSENKQMINFQTKQEYAQKKKHIDDEEYDDKNSSDIFLNLNIDANPNASLHLIMDEKSNDNILIHGHGNLKASFYNKGKFNMFGSYKIDDGLYKMSLQDIILKDFTLKKDGEISFNGDPMDGNLNLKAIYTVNSASLSDLSPNGNFSSNRIKVDCILNFAGKASAPKVSFDLDMPTIGDDEKRMVKSLISTDEEMNMQIIYLLGIGRFYTYDYATTATSNNQSQSSVAMKSFLSSTLSSHLNDILANAIGVKNWTFGANLSTGNVGWSDMEVEGLLNGRLLNNRLLINGNFGYRDRPNYQNNFIGDFDIRWLLTPSGSISLKAYSETNDRYFTKSALTTQGGGIILKRDFQNIKDLFKMNKNKK